MSEILSAAIPKTQKTPFLLVGYLIAMIVGVVLAASQIYLRFFISTSIDWFGLVYILGVAGILHGLLVAKYVHHTWVNLVFGLFYVELAWVSFKFPFIMGSIMGIWGENIWDMVLWSFTDGQFIAEFLSYFLFLLLGIALSKKSWSFSRHDVAVYLVPLLILVYGEFIIWYIRHYFQGSLFDNVAGSIYVLWVYWIVFGVHIAKIRFLSKDPGKSFFVFFASFFTAVMLSSLANIYWNDGCLRLVERTPIMDCGINPDPGYHLGLSWFYYVLPALIVGWLPYRIISYGYKKFNEFRLQKGML